MVAGNVRFNGFSHYWLRLLRAKYKIRTISYDLVNLGYDTAYLQLDNYMALQSSIPTHSHILQGWVWAGLAGALFWLFIFGIIARGMIMAYRSPTLLLGATLFLGFSALWDILFSPLSNIGRLRFAFVLVTILYALAYKSVFKNTGDKML